MTLNALERHDATPDIPDTAGPDVLAQTYAATQDAPPEPYMPQGYAVRDGQLCFMGGEDPQPFADPLHVLAMARAEGGQDNWGRLVSWQNADGQAVQWAMPCAMLGSDGAEYRRVLLGKGYHIRGRRAAQNLLHNYLSDARPTARALAVSKPGWHGARYVAPDGVVYGPQATRCFCRYLAPRPPGQPPARWRDGRAPSARGP